MKKLAIFVEGKTERLFVDRLLVEILGAHNISIEHMQISGGSNAPRQVTILTAASTVDLAKEYYVLICDCGGDHQVAERIREEHQNLTQNGYSKIIGVRDVSPLFTAAEIPRLEAGLVRFIDTSLIPVEFVLSIMELESWFLAEYKHFEKIDTKIRPAAIQAALGFDPVNDKMEERVRPSHDIDDCYKLGRKRYVKPAQATIDAIDYAFLYVDVKNKVPSLNKLISLIDSFI